MKKKSKIFLQNNPNILDLVRFHLQTQKTQPRFVITWINTYCEKFWNLDHPAQNPDLNSIEQLRDEL